VDVELAAPFRGRYAARPVPLRQVPSGLRTPCASLQVCLMDDNTAKLVDSIRDAVNARITGRGEDVASLRELARQIGMAPSGLSKFVAGSAPYTKTLRKLRRWHATNEPGRRERQKRNALADLLAGVPPAKRAEAERIILDVVNKLEGSPTPQAGTRRS
jgi:hypothetical protein